MNLQRGRGAGILPESSRWKPTPSGPNPARVTPLKVDEWLLSKQGGTAYITSRALQIVVHGFFYLLHNPAVQKRRRTYESYIERRKL